MSGPVAVFDFDGVLIGKDSTVEFIRRRTLRRPWMIVPMLPTLGCYLLARHRPAARSVLAKALIRVAMAGSDADDLEHELHALGRELGESTTWPVRDAIDAAHHLAADGYRVIVVSAGLEPTVRGFLAGCGLGDAAVIASGVRPARFGSRMSPHNFHRRKVESVIHAGFAPPWAVVHSDSPDDLPLMKCADRVVLVNPSTSISAEVAAQVDVEVTEVTWS